MEVIFTSEKLMRTATKVHGVVAYKICLYYTELYTDYGRK
jgi:hypothetical protein